MKLNLGVGLRSKPTFWVHANTGRNMGKTEGPFKSQVSYSPSYRVSPISQSSMT